MVNEKTRNQPGPGEYHSPGKFGEGSVKVTIGAKREERVGNNAPGPGSYNENPSVGKYSSPCYKIGDS